MIHDSFAAELLAWYDTHRRILPWRTDPAPYHVWLSEIMLQQTRVEAVRGYYTRFLAALPDIASLAAAPEDVYTKLWEGLGYYTRVRNLHRGAQMVMEQYGGRMPETAAELLKIPGIGEYTAAAIASIAFHKPEPAVDGNLLRIYARLTACDDNIRDTAVKRGAQQYYRERISPERPGDMNQALMDLGSMVCTPGPAPLCGECPLQVFCAACASGIQGSLPRMPEKKARRIDELTIFLIHDADTIALRKRAPRGLLAGLYEYPHVQGHLTAQQALETVRGLGFAPLRIRPLPEARHIFTHREWDMRGFEIMADELQETVPGDGIFLASIPQIRDIYAVPSAFSAYTSILLPKAAGSGNSELL